MTNDMLEAEIERSKVFLTYKKGWDSYAVNPISPIAWNLAVEFLRDNKWFSYAVTGLRITPGPTYGSTGTEASAEVELTTEMFWVALSFIPGRPTEYCIFTKDRQSISGTINE